MGDDHTLTIKEDDVMYSAITQDLSAGGLLFSSDEAMAVGKILDINIQLDSVQYEVSCLAKVCRAEKDEASGVFNVAVYYLDITSEERVKLNDFVKRRLQGDTRSLLK